MAAKSPDRKLLIVNLIGTIAYRSNTKVLGVDGGIEVRGKYYYPRPDLREFLTELSERYAIYIWSSLSDYNINNFLSQLMPNHLEIISGVKGCRFTKPHPHPVEEWETVPDIEKIWKSSRRHSKLDTVVLESDLRKIEEFTHNTILIPVFTKDDVKAGSKNLATLQQYLVELDESKVSDVRKFLEVSPFSQ